MLITQEVIVLSVSQYQIPSEKTGEIENEGTTVRYLLSEDLSPHEEATRAAKGRVPAKANLTYDSFGEFKTVPGLYEAALDYTVDSKGKAALTATVFKFVSALTVSKTTTAK